MSLIVTIAVGSISGFICNVCTPAMAQCRHACLHVSFTCLYPSLVFSLTAALLLDICSNATGPKLMVVVCSSQLPASHTAGLACGSLLLEGCISNLCARNDALT